MRRCGVPRGPWFGEKAGEMLAGRRGKGLGLEKVGLDVEMEFID